jgi:hypothetical protein
MAKVSEQPAEKQRRFFPVGHIENIMHSKLRRGSRWPNLKIKRGLIVASAASLALGACATSSGLGQREILENAAIASVL